MYDVVIIGAGTAGMSAAIYTVRAGKTALMLEGNAYGGQIINTPDIENYPGIAHISGFDFATGLYEQALALGAELEFEKALSVKKTDGGFEVLTAQNSYPCKAVILATGAKNRPLGLPNEQKLIGHGVSYCATCDGMFFRGRDVAVNGGGNTALEDALFLSNYCNKVYLVHRRDQFRGDLKEVQRLREKDNIEFVLNSTISEIKEEEDMVSAIVVKDKFTGDTREIPVAGLFVAIGQEPDNLPFANVAELDEKGYISAGEDCTCKIPGVFTAGDCRTKTVRQLTTAASDGAVAALAACGYIDEI